MGLVTPPIHFDRVILYVWDSYPPSRSSKGFFWSFLVVYRRPLSFPFSVTMIIQYALYIIFLKTLHIPSVEGVLLRITVSTVWSAASTSESELQATENIA